MDRVAVPSVGVSLSAPLRVVALVGRYPTNKLMRRRPLKERIATLPPNINTWGTIGNYPAFRRAMPDSSVRTCVLLPRLPVPLPIAKLGPLDLHALSTPLAFILS